MCQQVASPTVPAAAIPPGAGIGFLAGLLVGLLAVVAGRTAQPLVFLLALVPAVVALVAVGRRWAVAPAQRRALGVGSAVGFGSQVLVDVASRLGGARGVVVLAAGLGVLVLVVPRWLAPHR